MVLLDWYGLASYQRARMLQSTRAVERTGSCIQEFFLFSLPKMDCQKFKNTAADDCKARTKIKENNTTFLLLYDFALPLPHLLARIG